MNYLIYDGSKGSILMEQSLFELHQERFDSLIYPLISRTRTDGYVLLQTTEFLPNKEEVTTFINGSSKEETSCNYCKHRLKCVTTNWNCTGYAPVEKTIMEAEQLKKLAKDMGLKIIYAKVV